MTEQSSSFDRLPRPLQFARVRIEEFGAARFLEDLLREERDTLIADLQASRARGDDTRQLETELKWCSRLIAGASRAVEDLAGKEDAEDVTSPAR